MASNILQNIQRISGSFAELVGPKLFYIDLKFLYLRPAKPLLEFDKDLLTIISYIYSIFIQLESLAK